MFNDARFRKRMHLSGVNSINWGRIVAQIVYYFAAAVALGAPHRPVSFTVPTGNFGNIFAGYAAKRMGLPIERLIVATNMNDILDRTLRTGRYEVRGVTPTSSPSMDIQVSSNFERLLFELEDRDPAALRRLMAGLTQSGAYTLSPKAREKLAADFISAATSEVETAATIARVRRNDGVLVDPHTAVGVAVADRFVGDIPMITMATAHPSKFPDAVEAACGERPELPEWARSIMTAKENYRVIRADLAEVERAIEERSRVREAAA
jgi:threonine synthase